MFYSGGEVNYYHDMDLDKMSYFEIKGMVEYHGYTNVSKIYYRHPHKIMETGLTLLDNDKDVMNMLNLIELTGYIEIYVEHMVDESDNIVSLDDVNVENPGEANEYVSENSSDSSDGVFECHLEEDSEEESDAPSLDHVSDDEELIEIRKKVLSEKTKNKKEKCKVVSEKSNGEGANLESDNIGAKKKKWFKC